MAAGLLVAAWAALAVPTKAGAAATPPALTFEQAFSHRGEPTALHYRARYGRPGASHSHEVWRDGERRLVRRTDNAIETHVAHRPGDPQFQVVVLDLRRKTEKRIARDDLYRIGNFTEWFDLAHGLGHPRAEYHLTAVAAPTGAPRPLAPRS
ncbi:MAG: hypothetical protein KGN16_00090 [Burkholderiales bacterium]|nr:hypothetical protein [Burkholderiales bacterium]